MNAWSGHLVGRRWVLVQGGRGAVAIAVLGLLGCGGDDATSEDTKATDDVTPTQPGEGSTPANEGGLAWSRVDLGFVSAYVLVRGGEAAVVDTGVGGSADAIGKVLTEAGPGWAGVRHVVLTHKHADHAGSISDVLDRATQAKGYAGAADLVDVESGDRLSPLADGDDVLGLQIVATPGHTAGHLAVFDADSGVLVAGDALTNDGGLKGSNPQFTDDETASAGSIAKLAALQPTTILVGHGAPILDGAAAALTELAAAV